MEVREKDSKKKRKKRETAKTGTTKKERMVGRKK